ncbi:MAG: type VI secretion system baseplate subunit TssK [Alphaproteobacteria bacterium]|nr:type VI secretion system baseplate subunit TssK [Alphaproteobacteria bacterium]
MTSMIQWHEGMLMMPQHFQQTNNYFLRTINRGTAALSPFGYGVFDLSIDTAALVSGLVRVLKVSGLFQDGLFFEFDAMNDEPLELNLTEYFTINTTATKIYLAVPTERAGENLLEGKMARYRSSEMLNVKDENIGENAINIPILKPNLKLLQENQVDGRYCCFPIFEAEKSVEGGVVSTNFIAPYVSLGEHSKIMELCRDVVRAIRDKIAYFADRHDNFDHDHTTESLANLRLLIQAALPLESIIKINGIHPFEVYKNLQYALASIIAVNPTQLIPRFPVYNHEDLADSFFHLHKYALDVLNRLKQKYDIIKFRRQDDVFMLNMKSEWLDVGELAIGIQKPFSISSDDLLSWINSLQIASESMMPMIKDRRILGAERRIVERGQYITQPSGMQIIAVKIPSAYVKPNENLCLTSSTSDILPEEIILYADRK